MSTSSLLKRHTSGYPGGVLLLTLLPDCSSSGKVSRVAPLRACDFFDLFGSQHRQPLFINRHAFLTVIPSVPGFPTSPRSPRPLMWFSLKRNHMWLTEATALDRKSGEAEGPAVRHSSAPHFSFHNHFPLSSCGRP